LAESGKSRLEAAPTIKIADDNILNSFNFPEKFTLRSNWLLWQSEAALIP
jgi:hypothetical protein